MMALPPALEAMVREDPFDDARWMVLEDWLMEEDDPRAQIVQFEKEGDRAGANAARDRMLADLLGTDQLDFVSEWRAGFVQEAWLGHRTKRPAALTLLAQLLAAPAGRLVRQLTIEVIAPSQIVTIASQLAAAPCVRSLRVLTLSAASHWREAVVDLSALQVERLFLLGAPMRLVDGPQLARLRSLAFTPGHPDELAFSRGALPNVRELAINVHALDSRHRDSHHAFARLLAGAITPQLDQLVIDDASALFARRMFDALATSPLLAQLHSLALGDVRVDPADFGAAFAHLEILALPDAIATRRS